MLSKATFTYFNICLLHIHHTIIQVIQTQNCEYFGKKTIYVHLSERSSEWLIMSC